jgi:hypothetical protein
MPNKLNEKLDKDIPAPPRSVKVTGITKPSEVCERVLGNKVYVCAKNPTLTSQIESLVIEFE